MFFWPIWSKIQHVLPDVTHPLYWHVVAQKRSEAVKHTLKPSSRPSLYSWAGLLSSCLTWWQQGMTHLSIMVSPSTSSPLSPNTAAIVVEHCTCEKMPSHKSSLQTCSQSEPCWPAMSEACLAHAVFKTPCCFGPEGGVILQAFVAVQLVFLIFPAVSHLLVDAGLSDWRCLKLLQSFLFNLVM